MKNLDGIAALKELIQSTTLPPLVNADDWLQTEPTAADPLVQDLFDRGDKVALIASSKSKKTFFMLQAIICLVTGLEFLGLHIPKVRRVLHIQFEIQAHHFHRRLIRMCQALGVSDLGQRLFILNARGLGMSGDPAIDKIKLYAKQVKPDLITLDPLYKLLIGDENSNSSDGLKGLLDSFDTLAETTGAAVMYAHHDAKGSPGDRAKTDRGAGGGVLGRDYDAALFMTPHALEPNAYVIETSLRNYRPLEPFTVSWAEDFISDGYKFDARPDIPPCKKTSQTKKQQAPSVDTYLPVAAAILGEEEMKAADFRDIFKAKTGLSDKNIRGFLNLAVAGGKPKILERTDSMQNNVKYYRIGGTFE